MKHQLEERLEHRGGEPASGLSIALDQEMYKQQHRVPKVTMFVTAGTPSHFGGAQVMRKTCAHLSREQHAQLGVMHAKRAGELKALHSKELDAAAMETFGHKYDFRLAAGAVALVCRDEFSEARKCTLRELALGASAHFDLAINHTIVSGHQSATAVRLTKQWRDEAFSGKLVELGDAPQTPLAGASEIEAGADGNRPRARG